MSISTSLRWTVSLAINTETKSLLGIEDFQILASKIILSYKSKTITFFFVFWTSSVLACFNANHINRLIKLINVRAKLNTLRWYLVVKQKSSPLHLLKNRILY